MTTPNYFLAYASSASHMFTPAELVDLLKQSRTNNGRVGLTGLLLYRGGNFVQALEGPEVQVRSTMERIGRDPRHRSVILLDEGSHEERLFGDWSMGFQDMSSASPADSSGLSNYLSQSNVDDALQGRGEHNVFEFFRAFREHMR